MHGIRLPSLSIVCTAHFLSTTAVSNIISIINSAVNMTLATFAVKHHAAAPLLLGARHFQSISPTCTAPSSKPAKRRCCGWVMGQTDGRTNTRLFHRPCSAYYAGSVNNKQVSNGGWLSDGDMTMTRSRYRRCRQSSLALRSSVCMRRQDKPSRSTSSVMSDSLLLDADSCSSCVSTPSGVRLARPLPDTSSTRRESYNIQ